MGALSPRRLRAPDRALAELLRAVAAARPASPEPFHSLNSEDWEALTALVLSHKLAIAVAPELARLGMPPHQAEVLAETARRHHLHTQVLLLDLAEILRVLEAAGAGPVVLKGAALAQAFGRPRVFGDLDVLVPKTALEHASQALEQLGYRPHETVRARVFYERYHFHRVLRGRSGITLELHWALSRPSDYFFIDPEGIRARARVLPFQATTMRVPHESDQLLHAAAQSLREGFVEARRILDTHLLLEHGAADEPALADRARDAHLSTALWLLLRVSGALLRTEETALAPRLRPARWRRACLEALDPVGVLLERRTAAVHGLRGWIVLLCAPSAGVTAHTLWRNVFPGERGLLDDGHAPDALPGRTHRLLLALKRLAQTGRLLAYQFLCLLRRQEG